MKLENRQKGALLIEMMVAMAILTVGILGFFHAFQAVVRSGAYTIDHDRAQLALRDVKGLLRSVSFGDIYTDYHGTSVTAADLEAPGGGPASVQITCFVDETNLPSEFGPVLDLDGSGGLDNTDCSTSYEILPVRLSLTYRAVHGPETAEVYMVINGAMRN